MYSGSATYVAIGASVWLGLPYTYSFIANYLPPWKWFEPYSATVASVISAGISLSVLQSGLAGPDRLHRWTFPYEDRERPGNEGEMWFRTDRHWTHTWAFGILAALIAYLVGNGPSVVYVFFLGWTAHCVVDAFSLKGAPIFIPWKRVSLLPLKEGTYQDRRFMSCCFLLMLVSLSLRYPDKIQSILQNYMGGLF